MVSNSQQSAVAEIQRNKSTKQASSDALPQYSLFPMKYGRTGMVVLLS